MDMEQEQQDKFVDIENEIQKLRKQMQMLDNTRKTLFNRFQELVDIKRQILKHKDVNRQFIMQGKVWTLTGHVYESVKQEMYVTYTGEHEGVITDAYMKEGFFYECMKIGLFEWVERF